MLCRPFFGLTGLYFVEYCGFYIVKVKVFDLTLSELLLCCSHFIGWGTWSLMGSRADFDFMGGRIGYGP